MAKNPLQQLHDVGQSIWLDYIRRSLITTGELDRMIAEDAITGITSNPSIFEKAIGGSSDYDFVGSLIAKSIKLNGHFMFHYDEDLITSGPTRGYTATHWTEI